MVGKFGRSLRDFAIGSPALGTMPGLRRQPGISSYTNSLYHADMHTPAQQYSWDREHSIVSRRAATASTRQTVPRPPQWLKQGRENHNYLGTKAVTNTAPTVPIYGSNESDDLQAMVHDFLENDSLDYMDGADSDEPSPIKKLIDTLQTLTAPSNSLERELLTEVKLLLLSIKEDSDLICEPEGSDCKGGCVKRFVVNHLKVTGYDAGVCKSKWLSSGRVPGGEYEYIDVVVQRAERLIVDVDFQAQFEIARPTEQYAAALKTVPAVFVGSACKLQQVLQFMSEAAKVSLKQSDMHLPPWRTLDYMSSKWLSTFERKVDAVPPSPAKRARSYQWQETKVLAPSVGKQCGEQLRHTKVSLIAEMKSSEVVNNLRSSRALLLPRTVM